jgi:prolyl-tRNA synthetase
MPNGWALQSGTSHFLGQNFAEAFGVYYQTKEATRELVWATSWGVSTRLLGAMVMTHSDDAGLVLPPNIAPVQVVLVPMARKNDEEGVAAVNALVDDVVTICEANGIRIKVDDRKNMRPGAKFYEWERKGIPLRVDIGPRDAATQSIIVSSRIDNEKRTLSVIDKNLAKTFHHLLADIQAHLFTKALNYVHEKTYKVDTYDDLKARLDKDDLGFFQVYWCANDQHEKQIKEDCSVTIRCYPADKQTNLEGKVCFYSGWPATHVALFARAF